MTDRDEAITVLHVDNDTALSTSVEKALGNQGQLDVLHARSVAQALDQLADDAIECIVSEYDLPDTTGLDFLERLRASNDARPFIMFTGHDLEEIAGDAFSAGVTDYIKKRPDEEQFDLLANRCLHAVRHYRAKQRATELTRIRDVSRAINQALLRADNREELEQRVCEVIVETGPYRFAWIGVPDPTSSNVVSRAAAGEDQQYLDEIDVTIDDSPTGRGPTGQAIVTGAIQVVQDTATATGYGPWREKALARGFRSSAAVPFNYPDGTTGVLNVYSDRANAFDQSDRSLLAEIGDDISQAIHTLDIQNELRETSARLEALFEHSPNMINVHDAEGKLLSANARFHEKLGYGEAELPDMHVWDIDVSLDAEQALAACREMAPGDRLEVEGEYQRRDGTTFPVEVHLQRLELQGEDRYVVISRDITERRRREREREQIIDRVTDAIVKVDQDWRFTLVDQRAEEHYGLSESALLGEDFWEVFSDARGTIFETEYRTAMQRRESRSFEAYYDGLESWFDVQVYPDDDGGLSFYFQETTGRRERQRELERYETIVQTATDPIFVVDADCRFIKVNTALADAAGPTVDELVGNHLSMVADDASVRQVETLLAESGPEASSNSTFEMTITDADGNSRVHATSLAILQEDTDTRVAIGIAHDVTDLRNRERRLSVLDRVLRHNLKNKLNIVIGHAQALSDSVDSAAAHRATSIVETATGLLELSESARRFQDVIGTDALPTERLDLAGLVDDLVEEARLEHPRADISITDTASAHVEGHRSLELALHELLTNAIIHNDQETPQVEVTLSVSEETVVVKLADNGPGLKELDQRSLQRGIESPLEHTQGLGLWLVQWTIEQHNGEFDIAANTPRGTTVTIHLPLASA